MTGDPSDFDRLVDAAHIAATAVPAPVPVLVRVPVLVPVLLRVRVPVLVRVLVLVPLLIPGLAACSGIGDPARGEGPLEPSGPPAPEAEPADPTPAQRATSANCGSSPSDWCASPAGDPCGAHRNAGACAGDPHCEGRPYTGESFVACQLDARCFASNCPTVGCVRRCEELTAAACRAATPRCSVQGTACARREACASAAPAAAETEDVPAPDEG